MLEHVDLFKDFYVVFSRKDALPQLTVVTNEKSETVAFDEAVYSIFGNTNESYTTKVYRFTFMLGGYDATKYTSERLFVTTADGTRVPISLVYKKGLKRDGKTPLVLGGYGSYGYPLSIAFDSERVSFLDRGGIAAEAAELGFIAAS